MDDGEDSISCKECCCGPRRGAEELGKGPTYIYSVLNANQLRVDSLFIIMATLTAVWISFSLIDGFALYEVKDTMSPSAGVANVVSHLGWWLFIEFAMLLALARATGFRLSMPRTSNKLEMPVKRAQVYIIFVMFMVVLSWIANVVQTILAIFELSYGISVLAIDRQGFLIAFVVLLGVFIFFLKPYLLWSLYVYYGDLASALEADSTIYDLTTSSQDTFEKEGGLIGTSIVTPLLKQTQMRAASRHGMRKMN